MKIYKITEASDYLGVPKIPRRPMGGVFVNRRAIFQDARKWPI